MSPCHSVSADDPLHRVVRPHGPADPFLVRPSASGGLIVADFFVSPKDYSDLRVESSQLARALAERWPDVRFVERDDAANTLRWAVRMPEGRELWGQLQEPAQHAPLDAEHIYPAD